MTKTNTLRELAQFIGILQMTSLDARCIKQAAENVPKLIKAYEAQPENRAGRRVRRPVRQTVRRMLGHLASAARHVGDSSPSRAEARKLIHFAGCCDDFAELERRASQYRGRHNKIVRGINDRKARERAREFWLDGDHSLLELKTVSQLRSVGKRLWNCVSGHRGWHYLESLRRGECEFWVLRSQGNDVGLLAVDTRRRQIGECAGMADEPVGWQRPLLLELQRALDASGDEVEEFVESGAFSLFVKQPNLHPVSVAVGERTYRVWSSTGELIICDDLERWSRFRLALGHRPQFPSYSAHGSALDVGELVCMVAISPELAALVAQCLPESNPGATEPLAEQRRRPRRRRTRRGL